LSLSFHGLLILVFQPYSHHGMCLVNKHFAHHAIWLQGVGVFVSSSVFSSFQFIWNHNFMHFFTIWHDCPCCLCICSPQVIKKVSDLKRIGLCALCTTCFRLL
jgi:hypothetical protein